MLFDAFCSHTALSRATSQRRAPAPRQLCIFPPTTAGGYAPTPKLPRPLRHIYNLRARHTRDAGCDPARNGQFSSRRRTPPFCAAARGPPNSNVQPRPRGSPTHDRCDPRCTVWVHASPAPAPCGGTPLPGGTPIALSGIGSEDDQSNHEDDTPTTFHLKQLFLLLHTLTRCWE